MPNVLVIREEDSIDDPAFDRRRVAFEMLSRGATLFEIGKKLGVTPTMAANDARWYAQKLYTAIYSDSAVHVLGELARLDRLANVLMDRAEAGDLDAVDVILKISVRKAKLMGLDQPVKFAHTVDKKINPDKDMRPQDIEQRLIALVERMKARKLSVPKEVVSFVQEAADSREGPVDAEIVEESEKE
jgi:hypothetical protein